MKLLMAFLAVCTLVAVVAAAVHGRAAAPDFAAPQIWSVAGISFLVALMGWMPTPVDASAWPSLWMQERARQTGHKSTLREALFDFNLGYFGSLITAVMFLSLGALVMFGTGETFAAGAGDFVQFSDDLAEFLTFKDLSPPKDSVCELLVQDASGTVSTDDVWALMNFGEEPIRLAWPQLQLRLAPGEGCRMAVGMPPDVVPPLKDELNLMLVIRQTLAAAG